MTYRKLLAAIIQEGTELDKEAIIRIRHRNSEGSVEEVQHVAIVGYSSTHDAVCVEGDHLAQAPKDRRLV